MDFEPGPFHVPEEMPLPARVFTPGRVLSLAADIQGAHGGLEVALGGTSGALASAEGGGLAVPDNGALAGASSGADAIVPGGDNDALSSAVGGGIAIDADGAIQQSVLPGPNEDEPPGGLDGTIEDEPGAPPEGGDEPTPLP